MEIWTSGIIEAEVNAAFFTTRNTLQPQLNRIVSTNYFGDAVEKMLVVFIVNRDVITEARRFTRRDKTLSLSIRAHINYAEFLESTDTHRVNMFIDAMKTMLRNTLNFDSTQFDKQLLIEKLDTIN